MVVSLRQETLIVKEPCFIYYICALNTHVKVQFNVVELTCNKMCYSEAVCCVCRVWGSSVHVTASQINQSGGSNTATKTIR